MSVYILFDWCKREIADTCKEGNKNRFEDIGVKGELVFMLDPDKAVDTTTMHVKMKLMLHDLQEMPDYPYDDDEKLNTPA